MWIFTDTGFISAVRKPEYPGVVQVRSRDRASLELIAQKDQVEIKRSPIGDRPFREWFLDRGSDLNYSNFKNRVVETRGKQFASALNKVWAAMLSVEDAEARSPLLDEDDNSLSHSDAAPQKKHLTKVPSNLTELTEQEQIACAEKAAEDLREAVFKSEASEPIWSEEDKS
jgi:hypothetical protein